MFRILTICFVFVTILGLALAGVFFVGPGIADDKSTDNTAGFYSCADHNQKLQHQFNDLPSFLDPSSDGPARDPGPVPLPGWEDGLFEPPDRAARQDTAQTWTFMFYNDADFTNAYDPFVDFAADAHSDDNVNVIMLHDMNNSGARVWYIDSTHATVYKANWREPDMGNYVTLRDFIRWGKNNYPADRYLVALYDHGGGWLGACTDVTNGGWLSMDEIKKAITQAWNVDIICFTAPCLMGAVESAYELRDCVDIYVGSEDLSGYAFWHGIMGDICDVLNNSSQLSNEDIAEMIIQFVEANQYWPSEFMTMSAVKASAVASVAQQVNAFSQYAVANMFNVFDNVWQARELVWEFGLGGTYEVEEIDLYDFALQYAALDTDPGVIQIMQDLMDNLDSAVVAECHHSGQPGAHGLSIYFPDNFADYYELYATSALDFAEDTGWDEFLELYLNYDVPVVLQHYAASWQGDHAEIRWTLADDDPAAELRFEVMRRTGSVDRFERINDPDIVRSGSEYKCRDYSVKNGETYTYRVEILEDNAVVTSFETELKTPAHALALFQNYPNPFNPLTEIEFVLPEDGHVVLEVFDISGKRVRVLVEGTMTAGLHVESWDGRSGSGEYAASGLYFYRLATDRGTITKKCVLLR